MQVLKLHNKFNELQQIYGDKNLDPICGCGKINHPKLCLVFMNPTARNVSANKTWIGIKAPWIGTKKVWHLLYQLGFFSKDFIKKIDAKKPTDWDDKFSEVVYKKVRDNSIYITELSKATQVDARVLSNDIFRKYMALFKDEMDYIKPQAIIAFGSQVSSILLDKNIKISEYRRKYELLKIKGIAYKVFPVYYPVGQGTRNAKIAKKNISWIIKNQI